MALAGAPVLLKQGYLQTKGMFGWKREYYRLLQDSLFKFATHESKIPLAEFSLNDGSVEDASWEMKAANMLRVQTSEGNVVHFVCENGSEHRQWFDSLYYATTLTRLAEYTSPLSGGWLSLRENNAFVKRWFVIKDTFLLCYASREDMNKIRAGAKTKRLFVLPLVGAVLAYYKSTEPFTFAIQLRQHGEMSGEFVFAASSQTVMNVWMEVLYVSMGNDLPQFKEDVDHVAVRIEAQLDSLKAETTPLPSKSHHSCTKGTGVKKKAAPKQETDYGHVDEEWEHNPGPVHEHRARDSAEEGGGGDYEEEEDDEEQEEEAEEENADEEAAGGGPKPDEMGWNPFASLGLASLGGWFNNDSVKA